MARVKVTTTLTTVWLSARDTEEWAHRPGARWPCSALAGHRVRAMFDPAGDLVDVTVEGEDPGVIIDCPADEFDAIMSDTLRDAGHPDHPAIRYMQARQLRRWP